MDRLLVFRNTYARSFHALMAGLILFVAAGLAYDGRLSAAIAVLLLLVFPIRGFFKRRGRILLQGDALRVTYASGGTRDFPIAEARGWEIRRKYVFDGSLNNNNLDPFLDVHFDGVRIAISYSVREGLHHDLIRLLDEHGKPYLGATDGVDDPRRERYPYGEVDVPRALADYFHNHPEPPAPEP